LDINCLEENICGNAKSAEKRMRIALIPAGVVE
jgi:hypothetical protein